jgi:hypothetical protein
MTDIKIDYTENAFEKETLPKREVVRFYNVPDNLRDWKKLTKDMTAQEILELQEFIAKEVFKKLGR